MAKPTAHRASGFIFMSFSERRELRQEERQLGRGVSPTGTGVRNILILAPKLARTAANVYGDTGIRIRIPLVRHCKCAAFRNDDATNMKMAAPSALGACQRPCSGASPSQPPADRGPRSRPKPRARAAVDASCDAVSACGKQEMDHRHTRDRDIILHVCARLYGHPSCLRPFQSTINLSDIAIAPKKEPSRRLGNQPTMKSTPQFFRIFKVRRRNPLPRMRHGEER